MIELKRFQNGFEYIEVKNKIANAKIALQGAHVFHFARFDDKPLLWLSDKSGFETGKAIRGGVPICWPAFAKNNPDLPQHGFARVSMWELAETKEIDERTTQVTLRLRDTPESLKLWNYRFEVELNIIISDVLIMELKTLNLDDKAFKLTQALHTYFDIDNIFDVNIRGLDKKPYFDSLSGKKEVQEGDIVFDSEFDAVFQEVDERVQLITSDRVVNIDNHGSSSLVVWNPWRDKCKNMSDMRDDAYLEFVCIESANANEDFRILEPGEEHTLIANISY